jgi:hypothetical protein
MLGKRVRRPTSRAWGSYSIHAHNLAGGSPCDLQVNGPGCGLPDCCNRILQQAKTELRELPGIGRGVFVLEDLYDNQWVGEYSGEMIVSRGKKASEAPWGKKKPQFTLSGSGVQLCVRALVLSLREQACGDNNKVQCERFLISQVCA